MTNKTEMFLKAKEHHMTTKIGEARFLIGNREHQRILYYNDEDNKNYVIFNGEAEVFKLYSSQFTNKYLVGYLA
jgi:hypothetical protein